MTSFVSVLPVNHTMVSASRREDVYGNLSGGEKAEPS